MNCVNLSISILMMARNMFFLVYRLEEDVSLLKEGGDRLSVWVLRAWLL